MDLLRKFIKYVYSLTLLLLELLSLFSELLIFELQQVVLRIFPPIHCIQHTSLLVTKPWADDSSCYVIWTVDEKPVRKY